MKNLIFLIILAATSALFAQEFKPYESDINDAKIDRLDSIGTYLETFSGRFQKLEEDFNKEKAEHAKTKEKLKALEDSKESKLSKDVADLKKKIEDIEKTMAGLELDKVKSGAEETQKELTNLKKDYDNAKAMLKQIKLLIQVDYGSRLNKADSSNNKLRGVVEEINKIQIPIATPTPKATATPAATPTATPTAAATATPVVITTPAATTATPTPVASENFLDKYPLEARQQFCRNAENLKKFPNECLNYR